MNAKFFEHLANVVGILVEANQAEKAQAAQMREQRRSVRARGEARASTGTRVKFGGTLERVATPRTGTRANKRDPACCTSERK